MEGVYRRLRQSLESMTPGTVGGTLASASPIRERMAAFKVTGGGGTAEVDLGFPEPWAWYRSDDIAGAGDGNTVSNWPDRISTRDLDQTFGTGSNPIFRANRIDGHGSLGASTSNTNRLQGDYADYGFPDGVTIVAVMRDGHGDSTVSALFNGVAPFVEILTGPASSSWMTQFLAPSGFGELGIGGGVIDGAAWNAFLGLSGPGSPGTIRLWVGGVEPTPDEAVPRNDWSAFEADNTLIQPANVNCEVAEYIIWDRVLDATERGQVHDYLTARYPSLF